MCCNVAIAVRGSATSCAAGLYLYGGVCYKCPEGQYAYGSSCLPCSENFPGSASCTASDPLTCVNGFHLRSGNCVQGGLKYYFVLRFNMARLMSCVVQHHP